MSCVNIEDVDELTNIVMDIVRNYFKINPDSDADDELYGKIHNEIRCYFVDPEILERMFE